MDPRILDVGTEFWWVISFTPRLLYSPVKGPQYPLDSTLGGPQNRSLALAGTRTPIPRPSSP
jgi:hypothetical protein